MIIEKKLKSVRSGYKFMIERYNSTSEVVRDLNTREITSREFNDTRKRVEDDPRWYGVKNYQEALNLLHNGYIDKVKEIKKSMQGFVCQDGKRISFLNDVVGFAPIVPLAIQGVPNSMINTSIRKVKSKVIDVYYDLTMRCGTSSQDILSYGVKVLGALVKLEMQGYRLNLYAVQTYSDKSDCDMLIVKVKDAMQPLDLKRVSFPLMHTAFFRAIGFDWYSRTPKGTYRYSYGHNLSAEFHEDTDKVIKEILGNNAVYIAGARMQNETENHLMENIKNEKGSDNN